MTFDRFRVTGCLLVAGCFFLAVLISSKLVDLFALVSM